MFARRFGYFLSTPELFLITIMVASGCSTGTPSAPATATATGTPGAEQAVGERLFWTLALPRRF